MARARKFPGRYLPCLPRHLLPLHLLLAVLNACAATDLDGDGWSESEGDCDDQDAQAHPGAEELCDQRDNDCDGEIDEGLETTVFYADQDGDAYGASDARLQACA